MKKIHIYFLGLFAVFFITSATTESKETKPKRLFEKTVFIEVNFKDDSVLFKPLSKAWMEHWKLSSDINVNGTALMNYNKYKAAFNDRTDNLWTVLHPMIIDGRIQTYFPYDPETFGLGISDDGELRFPVSDSDENGTFLTSEKVRESLTYLLGLYGPMSDIPLTDEYGDYIIIEQPDGTQQYKYPAPDYSWYEDENIVKYKLRVSVLLNRKGKEKKRIIKSISPVVYRVNEMNEITGERELLWLDFEELTPFLKESYYFDKDWKSVSYLRYFQNKLKNASI